MAYQSQVRQFQASFVVGDLVVENPRRAQPFQLASLDEADNVIGRAFTITSEGVAQAGGTGVFAGILFNSKAYASFGTPGQPLAPTLQLPNGVVGEFLTMGVVAVYLPAPANIGDVVIFNQADGTLETRAPGTALPVGYSNAYAVVSRNTVTQAGVAAIELTETVPLLS